MKDRMGNGPLLYFHAMFYYYQVPNQPDTRKMLVSNFNHLFGSCNFVAYLEIVVNKQQCHIKAFAYY